MILSSPHSKISSSQIYSGSGNVFCITENDPVHFPIVELCLQYKLDGVIFHNLGMMRIFNDDGSEASMCGNGLRCLIAYLWDNGDKQSLYTIKTKGGIYQGYYLDGKIGITFPTPSAATKKKIGNLMCTCINTGVPHAVIEGQIGSHGPVVVKENYNLTAYQVTKDVIKVSTYERGLNRISLACGTGCMAVAFVLGIPKIEIEVPSGERLKATLNPPTLVGKVEKKETISILDNL